MRTAGHIYPRQSDRIARRAHRHFLMIATTSLCAMTWWAATTEIDRVSRGQGRVVPQTQNQVVQHFEGGIVTEILVREGEQVTQGQVLFRIENSFWRSELSQTRIDILSKQARLIRLEAEASAQNSVAFPDDLIQNVPKIVERELALFEGRRKTLDEQLAILDDQVRQKELELSELRARWVNTTKERDLVNQRVSNLRRLAAIGGVSANEMLESERGLQQIDSRLAELLHDIPRTDAALSEVHRRRSEARLRFRSDAEKERSDTEVQLAKNQENELALRDRSLRAEVLAPITGIVNKLNVTTVGGVVKSGEPLLQLVPADASIAVEARLSPTDRAEVWPGQPATVKISAYDYSIYGGMPGKVLEISPDALTDEKGNPYFRVRLEAAAKSFGDSRPVVPGMLAEVDILIGRRTILESLIRPVKQIRDNALRL
jgi:adhesin transport system membrane fusion protein